MNMRRQSNRFLSVLLSVCILAAILPAIGTTALAAEDILIDSDTTWDAQAISGNIQIANGATLTINGAVTIEGAAAISGGGRVVRGNANAYFSIGSGASLSVDGVTVDGNSLSSAFSMFDISLGALSLKNSTVLNCVKNTSHGGAVEMSGGTLTIENTNIQNCSATTYGGAIFLNNGATVTIKSGVFSGNCTTNTSLYGGGFIYNKMSTLIIDGGSFLNNTSAGRAGAIYNTGLDGTKTYIRSGVFMGNTSSYAGYEGSGAVFFSSDNTADTVLYISGNVRFGDGVDRGGQDGIFLGTNSSGNTLRITQISSSLQYPIHIYVACAEDRVIAGGVNGYALTTSDMVHLQFHDVGSSGQNWYALLDSEHNTVYLSSTEPYYIIYNGNGASGLVTDNTIYSSGQQVTVESAEGLTYEGHIFTGWNTKQDGSGIPYQPGQSFEISATTTLYAQWEEVYTVTLPNGDGCTASAANGSTNTILTGGSYQFTLEISDRYYKTDAFMVKANGVELTPDENGIYTIANITENQTVVVTGLALDNVPPTAEINLGESQWDSFLQDIAFSLFFKDAQTVEILSSDDETGLAKTEYFVSDIAYGTTKALEEAAGRQWKAYSGPFSIGLSGKYIVYAKVTDKVGNVGYASSSGIVLYTDAQQDTPFVSFVKTGTGDVTAEVTLNGNTIDAIDCDGSRLAYETHYTVTGGTVTFKADWLDTLPAGEHTLTVYYNPLGMEYVDAPGNDAPSTTVMSLLVQRTAGSVTITNSISKVFDGNVVPDVEYEASSTASRRWSIRCAALRTALIRRKSPLRSGSILCV